MIKPTCHFDSRNLTNVRGEVYHVIAAEDAPIGMTTRRCGCTEAVFLRNHGAWLPALFWEGYCEVHEAFHAAQRKQKNEPVRATG